MNEFRQLMLIPFAKWFLVNVIRSGRVPRHVAVVADGARRFGRKYGIPVQENHEVGCMKEILDWCLLLGVSEYSILMYSFGNYHRPKDEVGHWIEVLRIYLKKLIINWETLKKKGIRLNFYGKFSLIPEDINGLMGILVLITKDNTRLTVNMAMGYTSRHELSAVSSELISSIRRGKLQEKFLTSEFFNECLFAIDNRDVDLVIRTSGYHRISNFLCWQAHRSVIFFNDVLWPEFTIFHFMRAIFCYQASVCTTQSEFFAGFNEDEKQFLDDWKFRRKGLLLNYCFKTKYFSEKENINEIQRYSSEILYDSFKNVYLYFTRWFE